jgi:hypothetical protein
MASFEVYVGVRVDLLVCVSIVMIIISICKYIKVVRSRNSASDKREWGGDSCIVHLKIAI